MDDKNLHTDQFLNSPFAEPELPVDTAWDAMQLLLDAELPPSALPTADAGNGTSLWRPVMGFALICLTGIGSWLLIKNDSYISVKKEPQNNSLVGNAKTKPANKFGEQPVKYKATIVVTNIDVKNDSSIGNHAIENINNNTKNYIVFADTNNTNSLVRLLPANTNTVSKNTDKLPGFENKKHSQSKATTVAEINNSRTEKSKNRVLLSNGKLRKFNVKIILKHTLAHSSFTNTDIAKPLHLSDKNDVAINKLNENLIPENESFLAPATKLKSFSSSYKKSKFRNSNNKNTRETNLQNIISTGVDLFTDRFERVNLKYHLPETGMELSLFPKQPSTNFKVENDNITYLKYDHSIPYTSANNKQNKGIALNKKIKKVTATTHKNSNNTFLKSIDAGLQWNFNAMLHTGSNNYFTARNGKSEPLLLLLPGVWVSKKINKSELFLSFNLLQQNYIGNQLISTSSIAGSADSSVSIKTSSVNKTFGMSFGVQYNYTITAAFSIGAGIGYNTQKNVLLTKTVYNQSPMATYVDSTYLVSSPSRSAFLKSNFITAKLEAAYTINKFVIGAALQLPLTNLSATPEISIRPIAAQVFFRWRIKNN